MNTTGTPNQLSPQNSNHQNFDTPQVITSPIPFNLHVKIRQICNTPCGDIYKDTFRVVLYLRSSPKQTQESSLKGLSTLICDPTFSFSGSDYKDPNSILVIELYEPLYKNTLISSVSIPLSWFQPDTIINDDYPMKPYIMSISPPSCCIDTHLAIKDLNSTPFSAPPGHLLIIPSWRSNQPQYSTQIQSQYPTQYPTQTFNQYPTQFQYPAQNFNQNQPQIQYPPGFQPMMVQQPGIPYPVMVPMYGMQYCQQPPQMNYIYTQNAPVAIPNPQNAPVAIPNPQKPGIKLSIEKFTIETKIWWELTKILTYRTDLIDVLKPFMCFLNSHNINDEKYISFLHSYSKFQLKLLFKNGILSEERFNSLVPKEANNSQDHSKNIPSKSEIELQEKKQNIEEILDEIMEGDKCEDLRRLINDEDLTKFQTITKSFNEAKIVIIPIIQYSIMKNAIKCFKLLLVNGYDDPNKTMKEQYQKNRWNRKSRMEKDLERYEWDCMATAIYFGNIEIVKILEEKGIKKGKNESHIKAAILSFRSSIMKSIIEERENNHDDIEKLLSAGLFVSANNNNIQAAKFLIKKGININTKDASNFHKSKKIKS